MQLWTYQPPGFRIDDSGLVIDPRQGSYWRDESWLRPRYHEVLPVLWENLGTDQFLWCCTVRGWTLTTYARDPLEWELNVPESQILAFIRESVWVAILRGESNDWAAAILPLKPAIVDRDTSALVRVPLSLEGATKCHGKVVLPEWRKEAEFLQTSDSTLQRRFIEMYRASADDPKNDPVLRRIYAERVDYLENFLTKE